MPGPEAENELTIFPLTRNEYLYITDFANGGQPIIIAEERQIKQRLVTQAATNIRAKLASRTMAQAVLKAQHIGIKIGYPREKVSLIPPLNNLPEIPGVVLRRLAGGYHAGEIDNIDRFERMRAIRQLYVFFEAATHPQLIHHAVNVGFFAKHQPIVFSEQEKTKIKPKDRLTDHEGHLLQLLALGNKTYQEMAQDLGTTYEGVHHGLAALGAKIARISGKPTNGRYDIVTKAADLQLLPIASYLELNQLDPNLIKDLPEQTRTILLTAYDRAVTSGAWGVSGKNITKTLREIYKSLGAQNPTQAVLMLHPIKQAQKLEESKATPDNTVKAAGHRPGPKSAKERPTNTYDFTLPNGQNILLTDLQVNAIADADLGDITKRIADLPTSGYVSAAIENNGGRVIAVLAGILTGDTKTYTPRSTDLTYPHLINAYRTIARVLEKNPHIMNVGMILKFIDLKLKKLQESS